jgi:hypothetical protein
MAPVIASMVAGGLMSSLKSQGFSNILGQLGSIGTAGAGGTSAGGGGLAGLFSWLIGTFGALTGGQTASGAASGQSALDALKGMLQPGKVDPQHQAAIGDVLNRRV